MVISLISLVVMVIILMSCTKSGYGGEITDKLFSVLSLSRVQVKCAQLRKSPGTESPIKREMGM